MSERRPDACLWAAMGIQTQVSQTLAEIISGETHAVVISGPPGCGKTWLARSIGASFVDAGGVAIRGVGDDGEASRRLYPLQRAQAETSGYFKPAVIVGKALANVAAKVASGGMLDAEGAIQAFDAEATRRKRGSMFLAEDEQSLLSDLAVHAAGKPTLLIVDNLHWWDQDSLSLLRAMLKREPASAFPFLDKLRVVATTTDSDYQQPIWRDTYAKHVLPLFRAKIEMGYVSQSHLMTLRQTLAIPDTVNSADLEFVHDISGGHLTVIGEACKYISESGTSIDGLAPEDKERFVEDLFLQRLRNIGTIGKAAKELLHAASIIGSTTSRMELLCVYRQTGNDPEQAIEICRDLGFLEVRGETIEFRHHYIKEFFAKDLGPDEKAIRRVFSGCLCQLTPHDYQRRARNLLKSGDRRGAADLFVAATAENARFGRPPYHLMSSDEKALVSEEGMEQIAEYLHEGYSLLSKGRFDEACTLMCRQSPAYSQVILAEIEYVRSQGDLYSRDAIRRAEMLERLQEWLPYLNTEFDQGLRLAMLYRSGLVLEFDKAKARAIEGELTRKLSERIRFDDMAESRIHMLGRSAESLFLPDIALHRAEAAVKFHRPAPQVTIREPAEYYRCLTNLTALNIANGRYAAAITRAVEAVELADRFTGAAFPRSDMVRSMLVMARFRTGAISAEVAADEMSLIIENYGVSGDPYYTTNQLGVYFCLSDKLDEGIELFSALKAKLEAIGNPEPNPLYFVSSNLCCAKFLNGSEADSCKAEWGALNGIVDCIPYETRHLLQQRHRIMARLFNEPCALSPEEWDTYPTHSEDKPLHPCWVEIGRGFRMPDVQFWSMY